MSHLADAVIHSDLEVRLRIIDATQSELVLLN